MKKILILALFASCIVSQSTTSFAQQHHYPHLIAKVEDKSKQKTTIHQNKAKHASTKTNQPTPQKAKKIEWTYLVIIPAALLFIICILGIVIVHIIELWQHDSSDPLADLDNIDFSFLSDPKPPNISLEDFQANEFILEKKEDWLYYISQKGDRVQMEFTLFSTQFITDKEEEKMRYTTFSKKPLWINKKFKKVHWKPSTHMRAVQEHLDQGYDLLLIVYDNGKRARDAFFIHPQLKEKMISYLKLLHRDAQKIAEKSKHEWRIIDDISSWEFGTLLCYAQEEAFAFTFGGQLTKKAYPNIKWRVADWNMGADEIEEAAVQGLNRIRTVFGEDLQYLEAGRKPDGKLPKRYAALTYTLEDGWRK